MEWSVLPPLPSWLRPLSPPPALRSLKPLPPCIDRSQLKPLPPLNGAPFGSARSNPSVVDNVIPYPTGHEEGPKQCRRPLEQLLMDLRRYNQSLQSPEVPETITIDDSEEEGEVGNEDLGAKNSSIDHGDVAQTAQLKGKNSRMRKRDFEKRKSRVTNSLKTYATESKPGRIAYEARFAIRNGKWKRQALAERPNLLPAFPAILQPSGQEPSSSNETKDSTSKDIPIDETCSPKSSQSLSESPMSLCSSLGVPTMRSDPSSKPQVTLSGAIASHNARSKPSSPALSLHSLPHNTTILLPPVSCQAQSPRERVQRWVITDTDLRGPSSGVSSISSTPKAPPLQLEFENREPITPISPLASTFTIQTSSTSTSALHLDLSTNPLTPSDRDSSPIPGLLDLFRSEDALLINSNTGNKSGLIRQEIRLSGLSTPEEVVTEEPPPTPLEKEEVAISTRVRDEDEDESLDLFDGDLSEDDYTTTKSASEPPENPPSPLSTRFTITRTRSNRNMNSLQLPTPSSLSPIPLSREAFWFSGPRPLVPLKVPGSILARIDEYEETAQRHPAAVSGIKSRIRRESRVSGGCLSGQTQLVLSKPPGSRNRGVSLAGVDKKALMLNTRWLRQALSDREVKK